MTSTIAIEVRFNRAGEPRAYISGTRVRVQDIYAMSELQGMTPDEIVQSLPQLSLAQVHAAVAHYFEHREAILEEIRVDEEFVRRFRQEYGPGPLECKFTSRDANGNSVPPG